jgi:uncharacterized lipoprotein YajG
MNYTIAKRIILIAVLLLAGCASVSSTDTLYHGTKRYPPHSGNVDVYWKEQGAPADLRKYEFVATVKARSTWCGITAARFNSEVHNYIISRAGQVGGDAVVLYCGELGTTGECECYGDVYRKN